MIAAALAQTQSSCPTRSDAVEDAADVLITAAKPDLAPLSIVHAPEAGTPAPVEFGDRTIAFSKPGAEAGLAIVAAASGAAGAELVVELPRLHIRMAAQLAAQDIGDADAEAPIGVAGRAVVTSGPMAEPTTIGADRAGVRIGRRQPGGWRGGGGAAKHLTPIPLQRVNALVQPTEVEASLLDFHP